MTPSAIADSIVNLCGAVGLAVAMLALYRRDPGGPLTKRLRFPARRGRRAVLDPRACLVARKHVSGSPLADSGGSWCRSARSSSPKAFCAVMRRASQNRSRCAGAVLLGLGGALGLEAWSTPYAIALVAVPAGGLCRPARCCLACATVVSYWRPKIAASAGSLSARCWSFPSSSPISRRWRRICRCGSGRSAHCWSSPPC